MCSLFFYVVRENLYLTCAQPCNRHVLLAVAIYIVIVIICMKCSASGLL